MNEPAANFRFYEELNDFLPQKWKKTDFSYPISPNATIKDTIEAIGVPHTEVDLILINGHSVDFGYRLRNADRVSVYPIFETLNISNVTALRPDPLRIIRFILDVQLGKLARLLRMFGFDTLYENDYTDTDIVRIAMETERIILTRDIGILKRKRVLRGYWVRSVHAEEQIREVLNHFQLENQLAPFKRCIQCNTFLVPVSKENILERLPLHIQQTFNEFQHCPRCDKIYWKGSHYERMVAKISKWTADKQTSHNRNKHGE